MGVATSSGTGGGAQCRHGGAIGGSPELWSRALQGTVADTEILTRCKLQVVRRCTAASSSSRSLTVWHSFSQAPLMAWTARTGAAQLPLPHPRLQASQKVVKNQA
jgi:hypothetical protein